MILVDSSVWIETFRARKPLKIESVVEFDEIVTCLPVVQEVLQGFRDEGAFRVARESLLALPMVESPITTGLVEEAVGLYRAARRQGLTVRSSVDCLIAACALRHQLTVLHRDRNFDLLARVSPLQQRGL
ncbi:MAG: putative nucleic acid-binding protein contains PIN [Planctomycetota bacterium]|nr:MAG: putative nucleic acid-binding protein contains PIN [Planctomycetota bacterium]